MPAGNLSKTIAFLLLALFLAGPGSVILHILEETASCAHAEEPVHLEQPAPFKGNMQSGSSLCTVCEHGDKALPGCGVLLVNPPSIPAYPLHAADIWPTRSGDPPFIPPELNA